LIVAHDGLESGECTGGREVHDLPDESCSRFRCECERVSWSKMCR
jgi:hypothetical protein